MSLNRKVLLVIVITVAALMGTLYLLSSSILLRSFAQLEENDVRKNVRRALDGIAAQLAAQDRLTADWSNWDDTYEFMATADASFVEQNITPGIIEDLDIHQMVMVDPAGQVVYGYGFDRQTQQERPALGIWQERFADGDDRLLQHNGDEGQVGILNVPEGVLLVTSRPILTSVKGGPSRGSLVFARWLDEEKIAELSQTTHLTISVHRAGSAGLPDDVQAVRSRLADGQDMVVRPLNGEVVSGYGLVEDLDGEDGFFLQIEMPREVYRQGEDGLKYFMMNLAAAGLAFLIVTIVLMRRLVLRPLARLRVGAVRLGEGDLAYRIEVGSRDEIGQVGSAFNEMAQRLHEREQELAKQAESLATEVAERKRAQEGLRKLNEHLENEVAARTTELVAEINERKRAQEKLESYAGRLERSNRELQEFAYVSSHDLQEPLRKIRAFGDRLMDRYGERLDDQGRDYLSRMQSAAARMQNLIEGLLNYSRVTTKAQPFVPVDLKQVAQEVSSDLETRVAELHATVDIGDLPTITADPLQMRQLIQNLLGNALKFSREGVPPLVKITGRLNGHDGGNGAGLLRPMVEIRVEDNGIGFEEKYCDRIFQVFQRLHGRGQYEGAGIGLAVCRKIVERHGGTLSAKSSVGQGSVFIATLPLEQDAGEENQ